MGQRQDDLVYEVMEAADHVQGTMLRKPVFVLVHLICFLLTLGGCANRPGAEVLTTVGAADTGTQQVAVYVATTRQREVADANVFSTDRSAALNFASFTISIPPGHRTANIEWPIGRPDPAHSFAVTRQELLSRTSFRAGLASSIREDDGIGSRDIVVFVHGYNYNFQESLFRLAGLAFDSGTRGTPVLFAWPSEASLTGYVADKDAVNYSRDDLVRTLSDLTAVPKARRIVVFGHSMGAWLVMEALRQLRLTRQEQVIARLTDVVLAAPDIDVDVFRRQLEAIGPMPRPMTLLVSKDDQALELAGRIAGHRSRVGALDVGDPQVQALAARHRLRIVDVSEMSNFDGTSHSRFIGLVSLLPGRNDIVGAKLAQPGVFILDSVTAALTSPFATRP